MKTINEKDLERFCREIRRESGTILDGQIERSVRTRRLLKALFAGVCAHLDLDPNTHAPRRAQG